MKKALKLIGIAFVFFVVVLLIVPFFVSVDKYRAEIEARVGEATQSTVKLGELSLSLIPSLKIKTKAFEIVPKAKDFSEPIIKGDELNVSVPLLGLLFAPSATLELVGPDIKILEKNGRYNFETLMPSKEQASGTSDTPKEKSSSFIQGKIESARLTLKMTEAKLSLKSVKANANVIIDELLLKNLGFNAPIDVKIVSNVNYKDESAEVSGPFEFSGEVETSKSGESLGADFDLIGDFSSMLIKFGASFHKPQKIPLKFNLIGSFKKDSSTDVKVTDLNFEMASFKLAGKVDAIGIGTDAGTVDFDLQNKSSKLEDIAALSPLLSDYNLGGNVSFYAKAKGAIKNPALDIEFKADQLTGKTPKLGLPINEIKIRVKVDGTLEDPILNIDPADLLIGKSDLRLRVNARGKAAPDLKVSLSSNNLDLAFLNSGKESQAGKSDAEGGAAQGKALDASLDEMAPGLEKSLKNPILDKAKMTVNVNFKSLKLQGASLSNVLLDASYVSRNFMLKQASFSGYGGSVSMTGTSKLNASTPSYDYQMKLVNIDLSRAIAAHAPAWKGQMSGILKGGARFAGVGLKKSQTEKNLSGAINGEVVKGNTSLQLSKIVSSVMKQLPQRPDLKGNVSEDKLKGKFKTLKLDSKIAGRKILLNNIDVVFEPDEYNLGELQYKASGDVSFDRQLNLVGNVFLSPQVIKWPEAVGKSGKIEIPVKLSGPMDGAKPDIEYTIKNMGTRVLKKTVEKGLQKGVQQLLEGKKPEDILKGLFK